MSFTKNSNNSYTTTCISDGVTSYESTLGPDNTNFAAMFGVRNEGKLEKTPMPSRVCDTLKQFVESKDATALTRTTFRYIHMYLTSGQKTGRLSVACHDFGYSMEELENMRSTTTSLDVAREILGRK